MSENENNKIVCRRVLEELFNKGNLNLAEDIISSDCVIHLPSGDVTGVDGVKHLITMFLTSFPDLSFDVEDIIAEYDRVAARWIMRATHRGEFQGIAPTGKQVKIYGISFMRFANGKLAEDWVSEDMLGLLQQLGVIPNMR